MKQLIVFMMISILIVPNIVAMGKAPGILKKIPGISKKDKETSEKKQEEKKTEKKKKKKKGKKLKNIFFKKKKEAEPERKEPIAAKESEPEPEAEISEDDLSDEILDEKRKLRRLIKQKQFQKAYNILLKLPNNALTKKDRKIKKVLVLFHRIETEEKETESLFKKDETMDEDTKKTIKRLYKGAQEAILQEKHDLAKDLLIQALYLDRRDFKAKKLIEDGLGMSLGSYQVENVETKYWKNSLIHVRGGYPEKAIEDLKVLEYFDPENPEVFERLGSSYYLTGRTKEAIRAWNRALYLNPSKKSLEEFIENAKAEIQKQTKLAKEKEAKKKKKKEKKVKADVKTQTLGVFDDSNQAYSYAQNARKQLKGVEVLVEERDDGKWVVKKVISIKEGKKK